jgi:hypothetical protein
LDLVSNDHFCSETIASYALLQLILRESLDM